MSMPYYSFFDLVNSSTRTAEKKVFRAIYLDILLGTWQITTKIFTHILRVRKGRKPSGMFHQTPPDLAAKNYAKIFLKSTQIYIENSKYRQTGTWRGCAGTSNPGVTQKPDNPLKEIQKLVPNRTQNQWTCGLSMPTYILIKSSSQLLLLRYA